MRQKVTRNEMLALRRFRRHAGIMTVVRGRRTLAVLILATAVLCPGCTTGKRSATTPGKKSTVVGSSRPAPDKRGTAPKAASLVLEEALARPEEWAVVGPKRLSSVAWSPGGDQIAVVATDLVEPGEDQWTPGPQSADIWLARKRGAGGKVALKRVLRATPAEGIPTALFWLDSRHLGWVAAEELRYRLLAVDVRNPKPYPILKRDFSDCQSRGHGESFVAPDDAYYDASSHCLLLSGQSEHYNLAILNLSSGSARVVTLPDDPDLVTVCGSLKDPRRPVLYWAGLGESGWRLWRSHSYDLKPNEVVADRSAYMPRLSPDGGRLAWLESPQSGGYYGLVVYDPSANEGKVVAKLYSDWEGAILALGCPFSWSPDGTEIAYADKQRIWTVRVPPCR